MGVGRVDKKQYLQLSNEQKSVAQGQGATKQRVLPLQSENHWLHKTAELLACWSLKLHVRSEGGQIFRRKISAFALAADGRAG